MTLSEIFEEHSIKDISKKTNISEENLERILSENFVGMVKSKALGFISILERDYNVDLLSVREKALMFYDKNAATEEGVSMARLHTEKPKKRSKWFLLLMLGLLAYATWYFFTQFDKKRLSDILPFNDTKTVLTSSASKMKELVKDEESNDIDARGTKTKITVANIAPQNRVTRTRKMNSTREVVMHDTRNQSAVKRSTHTLIRSKKVILLPVKKLWFGVVDMDTGKRDHFTVTKQYKIDVTKKSWLVATSKADFAFINGSRTQEFNDAKSHYFKVNNEGIEELSKRAYVSQGGYKKW